MGRPKKSEPRRRQLNLSLTESELHEIERRARAVGMRPVHFGRALILEPGRRPAGKNAAACNHDALVFQQLSRLGNLLNQMVRHLHLTGDPLPADLESLLRDIRQLLARRGS